MQRTSNATVFMKRSTKLKGVRCSSLSARRSFAGKAVSGFGSVRSRRFRWRPVTVRRNTFSGSFHRGRGWPRPCTARWPARSLPIGSGARILRREPGSTIPGPRGGERSPSTRTGKGTGGKRGRTGSPSRRTRRASSRGCRGGTSSWSRASPLTGGGIVSGTGSGITTGSSEACRRACRGSGLPARASWFRKCRSTRGTSPSTRW